MGRSVGTRRVDPAKELVHRVERDRRIAPDVAEARAVELIEIAEILIVAADADVVGEETIRRGAADFDLQIVIERRRADAAAYRSVSRKGSGFNDLIDKAGQSGGAFAGRSAARVDLQLLLTERPGRA